MLSVEKEGLIISVGHRDTSHDMGNRLTTFEVVIVNPNSYEVDFIPRDFILLNEYGRQYFPLSERAMTEASSYRPYYVPVHFGFGYGFHHHPWSLGFHHYYDPFPSPRVYHSLISKALPLNPITIYPNSTVRGYLYYPVAPSRLRSAELKILRFTRMPANNRDLPPVIEYNFRFHVLR